MSPNKLEGDVQSLRVQHYQMGLTTLFGKPKSCSSVMFCLELSWWTITDCFHKRSWTRLVCRSFRSSLPLLNFSIFHLSGFVLMCLVAEAVFGFRFPRRLQVWSVKAQRHGDDEGLLPVSREVRGQRWSAGPPVCMQSDLQWRNQSKGAAASQAKTRNVETNMNNPPDLTVGLAEQHPAGTSGTSGTAWIEEIKNKTRRRVACLCVWLFLIRVCVRAACDEVCVAAEDKKQLTYAGLKTMKILLLTIICIEEYVKGLKGRYVTSAAGCRWIDSCWRDKVVNQKLNHSLCSVVFIHVTSGFSDTAIFLFTHLMRILNIFKLP